MAAREKLEALIDMGYTNKQIAQEMEVSVGTIKNLRRNFRLRKSDLSSDISDVCIDEAVLSISEKNPEYGEKMIAGDLESRGMHVTRSRIRESMKRVDPAGIERRKTRTIHRRQYHVEGPNSMWHIDGHHKLIRWRMVTHGGVDGYSRLPVYLKCSPDNKASTVLASFIDALKLYGLPKKVRADKGGENVLVADVMLQHPQRGVGTFITGLSVHNQWIERLWRDVHTGCISAYYNLFYKMEDHNLLNNECDKDIFALHYTFLPVINHALENFRQSFIRHRMRTEGNRTPLQMWRSGIHNIDWFVENDLPDNVRQQENITALDRVEVPSGIALTDEQLQTIYDQFPCSVTELASEEDQLNYFSALKKFIETIDEI